MIGRTRWSASPNMSFVPLFDHFLHYYPCYKEARLLFGAITPRRVYHWIVCHIQLSKLQ